MKTMTLFLMMFLPCSYFCRGQEADEIKYEKIKLEIEKINHWRRLDRKLKPVTDEEVKAFFEYIKESPVIEYYELTDSVAIYKIRAARVLHKNIDNEALKKQIIDLLKNTFKEIQAVRDTLGINPYSESEGYLYINPPVGPKDPSHMVGEKTLNSPRFHEVMNKKIKAVKRIENLEQIHGNLYDMMTQEMKIPLEGIPPRLERSPEEKARTKDMLEKQAAALGRKKPEPKAPADDEK